MTRRRWSGTEVAPAAEPGDRQVRGGAKKQVLMVGELGASIRAELADRGGIATDAPTLYDGFAALAAHRFDVVVVNPLTEGCGADFVSAIKEGEVEHLLTVATLYGAAPQAKFLRDTRRPPQEMLTRVRERCRLIPFIVLPPDGGWWYAIVVTPPHATVMQNLNEVPLVTAILTANAAALIGKSGALA